MLYLCAKKTRRREPSRRLVAEILPRQWGRPIADIFPVLCAKNTRLGTLLEHRLLVDYQSITELYLTLRSWGVVGYPGLPSF